MRKFTPFPSHFNVVLKERERGALEDLYSRDDHLVDEVELINKVMVAGIKALVDAAERGTEAAKGGDQSTGKPPVAPAFASMESLNPKGSPSRNPVERYVGFPIEERLRQKLEGFLETCPDALTEEDTYARLLDLGLDEAAVLPIAELKRSLLGVAQRGRLARLSLLAHGTRRAR